MKKPGALALQNYITLSVLNNSGVLLFFVVLLLF